jgi:ABC-2 type transport system ATP-binding protein
MISAQSITKRFGQFTAVDNVSFEVERGQILGFIGPNGAGKTTSMRMLTGFLPATEGRAVVAGHDVFEENMLVRRKVGYLPERPPLYTELSIGAYLAFVAEVRGIPHAERTRRIGEVMEQVGLVGWEHRILGSLSKGYRQRVGLAQAVIHNPEVLILDEPTSGLDPGQVAGIRSFIRGLAEDRTVILSTHILPEVERLCERVVIIADGKVAADDTIEALKNRVGQGVRYRLELKSTDAQAAQVPQAVGALEVVDQVTPVGTNEEGFEVMDVRAPADPRTAVARLAIERGWTVRAMEHHAPSLEEAFLSVVGHET